MSRIVSPRLHCLSSCCFPCTMQSHGGLQYAFSPTQKDAQAIHSGASLNHLGFTQEYAQSRWKY